MLKIFITTLVFLFCLSPLLGYSASEILDSPDVLGYIFQKDLYILDFKSGKELRLTTSGKIEDFCWQNTDSGIYTLSYDRDSSCLVCKHVNLLTGLDKMLFGQPITAIKDDYGDIAAYLRSEMYINSALNLVVEVYFGANYPTGYQSFIYDFKSNQVKEGDRNSQSIVFSNFTPLNEKPVVTSNSEIINRKVGNNYELYIRKPLANTDPKKKKGFQRLTCTDNIERELMFTDGQISFSQSPDSSVIAFGFETLSGDMLHGTTMIINRDGTGQQLLSSLLLIGNDLYYGWTGDNRFVYANEEEAVEPGTEDSPPCHLMLQIRKKTGKITNLKVFEEEYLGDENLIMHLRCNGAQVLRDN